MTVTVSGDTFIIGPDQISVDFHGEVIPPLSTLSAHKIKISTRVVCTYAAGV